MAKPLAKQTLGELLRTSNLQRDLIRDMADVLRQVEGAGQGLCMCEHLPQSERKCFDCRLADVLRRAGEMT